MPILPNAFQTPNLFVDELMFYLTSDEYRVLSYATRHIFGWKNRVDSRQHTMSLSHFENGYDQFKGCGLSRPTIVKVLKNLHELGILIKVGDPTPKGQSYSLTDDRNSIDMSALINRRNEQDNVNKKRTKKARVVNATNHLETETHPSGIKGEIDRWLMPLTSKSDLPNKSQLINNDSNLIKESESINLINSRARARVREAYERGSSRRVRDDNAQLDSMTDVYSAERVLEIIADLNREKPGWYGVNPILWALKGNYLDEPTQPATTNIIPVESSSQENSPEPKFGTFAHKLLYPDQYADNEQEQEDDPLTPEQRKQWDTARFQLEAQLGRDGQKLRYVKPISVNGEHWIFTASTQPIAHLFGIRLARNLRRMIADVTGKPYDDVVIEMQVQDTPAEQGRAKQEAA